MVSKKVIIGAVVVIAIIAIAAVAVGGGSSEQKADVRYNYTTELVDSFGTTVSGSIQEAPEGSQYLLVKVKVANDAWSNGVTTNDIIWAWKVTTSFGVSYSSSVVGYLHPAYQLITVEKGGVGTTIHVFEIPDTLTLSDLTITQTYDDIGSDPKMERDEGLTV